MSGVNGDSLLLLPAIQGMVSLIKKHSKKLVPLSFYILHAHKNVVLLSNQVHSVFLDSHLLKQKNCFSFLLIIRSSQCDM